MQEQQLAPHLLLEDYPSGAYGVFWRHDPAFVAELSEFLQGRRVLEIFAGNGYLAAQLAAAGVAVTATSLLSGMDGHGRGLFHPVEALEAQAAVDKYGASHDVLLMCWPTVTEAAIRAVRLWGSAKDVAFIGEVTDYAKGHLGGCATDCFFEEVSFTRRFDAYRGNMLEQAAVCRWTGRPTDR